MPTSGVLNWLSIEAGLAGFQPPARATRTSAIWEWDSYAGTVQLGVKRRPLSRGRRARVLPLVFFLIQKNPY